MHAANISADKRIEAIITYDNYTVVKFSPAASAAEREQCTPAGKENYAVLEMENAEAQFSSILALDFGLINE